MSEPAMHLDDFHGIVRLFPLANVVLFPSAAQPLFIFEPRYRQMTADALASDRLIAMVLVRADPPGPSAKPAIHSVACIGRIIADVQLPDGNYNLVLRGIARARILEEVPSDRLYRQARVEILSDQATDDLEQLMATRSRLANEILGRIGPGAGFDQLKELFLSDMPLGQLCDVLAFALPMPIETKQLLLETRNVLQRAELIARAFQGLVMEATLAAASGGERKFPPDFSRN